MAWLRQHRRSHAIRLGPRPHHYQALLRRLKAAPKRSQRLLRWPAHRRWRRKHRRLPPVPRERLEPHHVRRRGLRRERLAKGDVQVDGAPGHGETLENGAGDEGAQVEKGCGVGLGWTETLRIPGEAAEESLLGHGLRRTEAMQLPR